MKGPELGIQNNINGVETNTNINEIIADINGCKSLYKRIREIKDGNKYAIARLEDNNYGMVDLVKGELIEGSTSETCSYDKAYEVLELSLGVQLIKLFDKDIYYDIQEKKIFFSDLKSYNNETQGIGNFIKATIDELKRIIKHF